MSDAPLQKRGRYWVVLNRSGFPLGNERYKTRRSAERAYDHYISLGGDQYSSGLVRPKRVPRGYVVTRHGYVQKRDSEKRTEKLIERGHATRFRKEDE
jgi:hypothetical protein